MKDTCALFTEMGSRLTILQKPQAIFLGGRERWMDGWMVGLLVGWMDGWMDGWKDGRLKKLQDFQKLQSHFLACSLVMNNHCCF